MTGLSILYTKQAREEKGWEKVPDREKPGRLREVYWARRAEGLIEGRRSFVSTGSTWRPDRGAIGRERAAPGDSFIHKAKITGGVESNFEWIEVTEVFTTTSAATIEGAMRAWNGIEDKQRVDLEEFRKGLKRRRPSRGEQRKVADEVIKAIKKKIRKTSYNEVVEKYGYGTLVVGLPLWFAVLPEDPFRAENSLDDFAVRTTIGMEEIRRKELRRKGCPFRHVIVLCDTTPEAIEEWAAKRSREYEDVANTTLMDPMPTSMLEIFSESLKKALERTGTIESEAPSCCCHLEKKVEKKKRGKGPYPQMVQVMEEMAKKRAEEERRKGIIEKLKQRIALELCKVLCFIKIHGIVGLERWAAQRISPKRYWRRKATGRRALRLYKESVRRAQKRKERMQLVGTRTLARMLHKGADFLFSGHCRGELET